MKQIQIVPQIYSFENFGEFVRDFQLDNTDLIITNEYIYNPVIAGYEVSCQILFQEKYGEGEPSDTMINAILKQLEQKQYNRIIAVGGGTIIDIAKVIAVSGQTKDVNSLYENMDALKAQHELIVVPTTCGTGSEVTNIAIVNRQKLGTKQGLVSEEMYPRKAVLIPEFIATLPYKVFATSSIDALIHAMESYLSPLATDYTKLFSIAAIEAILDGYCKVAEDKSAIGSLGGQFLKASNYAGIAFGNAGCGTIHAMSYALGGKYHVAHGESNYQFMMPVLELYKERKQEGAIKDLETVVGRVLSAKKGQELQKLKELLEKILPHKPMKEYGAVPEDIPLFTDSTILNQQRLLGRSYIPLTREDVQYLFSSCLA